MSTPLSDDVTDSILLSTKKLLGIDPTMDMFDLDVTMNVNSALANLNQIGIGPHEGFYVNGPAETWTEFLGHNNMTVLQNVKQYVYIWVKRVFDPPGATNHLAALDNTIKELEWRISTGREEVIRGDTEHV